MGGFVSVGKELHKLINLRWHVCVPWEAKSRGLPSRNEILVCPLPVVSLSANALTPSASYAQRGDRAQAPSCLFRRRRIRSRCTGSIFCHRIGWSAAKMIKSQSSSVYWSLLPRSAVVLLPPSGEGWDGGRSEGGQTGISLAIGRGQRLFGKKFR